MCHDWRNKRFLPDPPIPPWGADLSCYCGDVQNALTWSHHTWSTFSICGGSLCPWLCSRCLTDAADPAGANSAVDRFCWRCWWCWRRWRRRRSARAAVANNLVGRLHQILHGAAVWSFVQNVVHCCRVVEGFKRTVSDGNVLNVDRAFVKRRQQLHFQLWIPVSAENRILQP